jgi:poly[ADP-ribose] polymerase 16
MSSSLPSIENKRAWIEEKIEEMFRNPDKSDLLVLDLEINMLICALQSYKHETVVKPFPSTFLSDSNNNKNFSQLINAVESLPALPEWRTKLKNFTADQLSLIYWFFVHKDYELKYTTDINQEKLKDMSKFTENFSKPTHVFEINYNEDKTKRFEKLKEQLQDSRPASESNAPLTSICFHGTRLDNVYSILHMGLLSHFSKNALFGEGTYLSQEPSLSLHYSPANKTWNKSVIGQRMSCMLVAETINDPAHVKTGINGSKINF